MPNTFHVHIMFLFLLRSYRKAQMFVSFMNWVHKFCLFWSLGVCWMSFFYYTLKLIKVKQTKHAAEHNGRQQKKFQFKINCIYVVEPLANTNNNRPLFNVYTFFFTFYGIGFLLWVCLGKVIKSITIVININWRKMYFW